MWAKFLLLLGGCVALAFPLEASAQDSIFHISDEQSKSQLSVGVAGVVRETYTGSEESETLVLPYVTGQYKRFFFNPALGAGVYAIKNDQFRLGAAVNYALGRDGEDTPFNDEIFDVDPSVTASAFGRIYLPIAAIDAVATVPVTGDLGGAKFDLLASTSISPLPNLTITPGVRATYNTSGWANTNYGISAAQAAAIPGLFALDMDSGFAALGAHAAAYIKLSEDYEIIGVVNHSLLQGDIKDSPLTPKNSGTTLALGIARKF